MEKKNSFFTKLISSLKISLERFKETRKYERQQKAYRRRLKFKRIFDKKERAIAKQNRVKSPLSDKIFNGFNGVFMVFLVLIVVIPLLYLIANAFSDGAAKHAVVFLPKIIDSNGNIKTGITFR